MQLALKNHLQRLGQQVKSVLPTSKKAPESDGQSESQKEAAAVRAKKGGVKRRNEPDEPFLITPVVVVSGQRLVRPFVLLAVLTLAVVLSAISVIFGAYEYRQLFHEHQKLIQQRDDLQVEWGQLLLEQSAWAANNRVEDQARKKLEMLVPDPQQIEIVRRGN